MLVWKIKQLILFSIQKPQQNWLNWQGKYCNRLHNRERVHVGTNKDSYVYDVYELVVSTHLKNMLVKLGIFPK